MNSCKFVIRSISTKSVVRMTKGAIYGSDNKPKFFFYKNHPQYYFDGADEESEVCDINHNGGVCNCDMR